MDLCDGNQKGHDKTETKANLLGTAAAAEQRRLERTGLLQILMTF